MGSYRFTSTEFQSEMLKKFWGWIDSGEGYTAMNVLNATETDT